MSDDEDYFAYGTPLENEEGSKGQHARRTQEAAQTRALPVWQQEVTDEQGRKRFHGAFTGGYSAGFYNTVGSLEGWTPSQFTSSREGRNNARQQRAEDFMDEEELAEAHKHSLATHAPYDTFGKEAAQKAQAAAQEGSAAAVPGLALAGWVEPVPDSIGLKLLQRMGWRQGKGVGPGRDDSSQPPAESSGARKASKWGRVAGVAAENTPVYLPPAKTDVHGLGFDPFKGAEEFREAKRKRQQPHKDPQEASAKRVRGVAFGSGAGDEDDVYNMTDDYVMHGTGKEGLAFELASDEEDADVLPLMGRKLGSDYLLPGRKAPAAIQSQQQVDAAKRDIIPGFVATDTQRVPQSYPPPVVPPDYRPHHTFPDAGSQPGTTPQPPPAEPPPADENVRKAIDALAPYLSRLSPAVQALAVHRLAGRPGYSFLAGGEGAAYFRSRLHLLRLRPASQRADSALAIGRRSEPLNAEARGAILGETALPGSEPKAASGAASHAAGASTQAAAPKAGQPQQRPTLGIAAIADSDRKRLQDQLAGSFRAASTAETGMGNDQQPGGLLPGAVAGSVAAAAREAAKAAAARFVSSNEPASTTAPIKYPRRKVEDWRPAPLLCKRYGVADPYRGKAAVELPGSRFKSDFVALPDTEAALAAQAAEAAAAKAQQDATFQAAKEAAQAAAKRLNPAQAQPLPLPPPPPKEGGQQLPGPPPRDAGQLADALLASLAGPAQQQSEAALIAAPEAAQTLQRPMDLFKSIFEASESSESSDDDNDVDASGIRVEHPPLAEQAKGPLKAAQPLATASPSAQLIPPQSHLLPTAGGKGPQTDFRTTSHSQQQPSHAEALQPSARPVHVFQSRQQRQAQASAPPTHQSMSQDPKLPSMPSTNSSATALPSQGYEAVPGKPGLGGLPGTEADVENLGEGEGGSASDGASGSSESERADQGVRQRTGQRQEKEHGGRVSKRKGKHKGKGSKKSKQKDSKQKAKRRHKHDK